MTNTAQQLEGSSSAGAAERWHQLDQAAVERLLDCNVQGLSEVEARLRLERHGPNRLEDAPPPNDLAILLHQFRSPLIFILLLATIVTAALAEYLDSAVIAAVVVLNAGIGFAQERRAERAVQALMPLVAPRARVIRDGREWEVDSSDLVPGEMVLLESGSRVPADVRLISAVGLSIDESLLTGESAPVTKHAQPLDQTVPLADRANMTYTGSLVSAGRGRGYVVATAGGTEFGRIAERVREQPDPQTPLQRRMVRFARIVGLAVGGSAAAAFAFGVLVGESPGYMFLVAVALGVSAVPEGLPVVFTIALAVGVRRMGRRRAIIRQLAAVETIGSVSVIGSDKTGTLTENRMAVQRIWAAGRRYTVRNSSDDVAALEVAGRVVALAEHPAVYLTLARRRPEQRGRSVTARSAGWLRRGTPPMPRCWFRRPVSAWSRRRSGRCIRWSPSCRSSPSGSTRRACGSATASTGSS